MAQGHLNWDPNIHDLFQAIFHPEINHEVLQATPAPNKSRVVDEKNYEFAQVHRVNAEAKWSIYAGFITVGVIVWLQEQLNGSPTRLQLMQILTLLQ